MKNVMRLGDMVVVISGAYKGRSGRILRVLNNTQQVIVEGVNRVWKHKKPSPTSSGGRFQIDGPIHRSNVQILDPVLQKPTRVAIQFVQGKKHRVTVLSGASLGIISMSANRVGRHVSISKAANRKLLRPEIDAGFYLTWYPHRFDTWLLNERPPVDSISVKADGSTGSKHLNFKGPHDLRLVLRTVDHFLPALLAFDTWRRTESTPRYISAVWSANVPLHQSWVSGIRLVSDLMQNSFGSSRHLIWKAYRNQTEELMVPFAEERMQPPNRHMMYGTIADFDTAVSPPKIAMEELGAFSLTMGDCSFVVDKYDQTAQAAMSLPYKLAFKLIEPLSTAIVAMSDNSVLTEGVRNKLPTMIDYALSQLR